MIERKIHKTKLPASWRTIGSVGVATATSHSPLQCELNKITFVASTREQSSEIRLPFISHYKGQYNITMLTTPHPPALVRHLTDSFVICII